ncbi:MAG: Cof-type HAD-IIB family hydrolase [Bacillota bacterium]
MGVKLIAVDMDGTLMDNSHIAVSGRNKAALREAAEQGIHIVLASGRPLALMTDTAAELACVRYVITANGACVWDLKNDIRLADRSIPEEQTRRILDILTDYPIAAEVYCGGRTYVDRRTWRFDRYVKHPPEFLAFRAERNMVADDLKAAVTGLRAEKFNVDGISPEQMEAILARLSPFGDSLTINFIACYDNLEICRRDATKGNALKALCQALGIARDEVMAFGDSDNDADMLGWAEWSFFMSGGEAAAEAAARYQTEANTKDGIALAIEKHLFQRG